MVAISNPAESDEQLGDFELAKRIRLNAVRQASMSDRLARLHSLCLQMSAVKGVASR